MLDEALSHVNLCQHLEYAKRDKLGPPPHTDYYHQTDDEHRQSRTLLLKALAPQGLPPMKKLLHVGCGLKGREDTFHIFRDPATWEHVRLDIDPSVKPDLIDDVITLASIEDASFDGIFTSHNLEHLHYTDVFKCLDTFRRVLKPFGLLVIAVPDLQLAAEYIARDEPLKLIGNGGLCPLDLVYGYRAWTKDNPYMMHKTGFTQRMLETVLVDRCFTGVSVVRVPETMEVWGFAQKRAGI